MHSMLMAVNTKASSAAVQHIPWPPEEVPALWLSGDCNIQSMPETKTGFRRLQARRVLLNLGVDAAVSFCLSFFVCLEGVPVGLSMGQWSALHPVEKWGPALPRLCPGCHAHGCHRNWLLLSAACKDYVELLAAVRLCRALVGIHCMPHMALKCPPAGMLASGAVHAALMMAPFERFKGPGPVSMWCYRRCVASSWGCLSSAKCCRWHLQASYHSHYDTLRDLWWSSSASLLSGAGFLSKSISHKTVLRLRAVHSEWLACQVSRQAGMFT